MGYSVFHVYNAASFYRICRPFAQDASGTGNPSPTRRRSARKEAACSVPRAAHRYESRGDGCLSNPTFAQDASGTGNPSPTRRRTARREAACSVPRAPLRLARVRRAVRALPPPRISGRTGVPVPFRAFPVITVFSVYRVYRINGVNRANPVNTRIQSTACTYLKTKGAKEKPWLPN